MPDYYTYKKDADAAARPGQTVKFAAGRGYYLSGTASPAPAPRQISDAASASGYTTTQTKTTATPASKQPTAAAAAPQISDAATGGGYGSTATKQPTTPPTSPGTTTSTPVDRPSAPAATKQGAAPTQRSDAASSDGYGSRYYTYKADAQKAAKPGQKIGFTTGKGYYLYYAVIAAIPTAPGLNPTTAQPSSGPEKIGGADGTTPATGESGAAVNTVNGPLKAEPATLHPGTKPPPLGPRPRGVPTGWESSATKGTAKTAYDYFIGKGLRPVQAAALVGNFLVESGYGLSPRADNGIGNHGIAQWGTSVPSGQRWQKLESWAAGQGRNVYDLRTQLDFVWHEMSTSYSSFHSDLKKITNIRDVNKASDLVTRSYEGAVAGSGLQEPAQREYESRLVLATFLGK